MRISHLVAAVAAFAAAGAAPTLHAQTATGSFVIMLGNDTVAVERYTRTGNLIEGEIVSRAPQTTRTTYTASLGPDDAVSRLELSRHAPGSDSVVQRVAVRFTGDSAITEIRTPAGTQRRGTAAPADAVVYLGNSFAMQELALQRARRAGRDSVQVPMYPAGATETWTLHARRTPRDSVYLSIALPGGEIEHEGRIDARGRIQELRGVRGSYGSNAVRAERLDLRALRRDFEARDAAGRGLGPLSPRDTTHAEIAGATIEVDYSRPSARGRAIMGGLLHEGTVWRLGANQATHLRSDRDLVFGSQRVPAGTYTLFAIPGRDRWTLIVNRQTGQWGTMYDESQDLVRIPMTVSPATSPQEQFTIAVQPGGDGGQLRIMWGDVVASAPFSIQ